MTEDKSSPAGELDWPEAFDRTPAAEREQARFETPESRCWGHIQDQARLMGATDLVIETAKPHKKDGTPYASATEPEDPGAVVRWRMHGHDYVIACDHWTKVKDNLRAIGLTLEAMRGVDRWAAVTTEQAFQGLESLPPPTAASRSTAVAHELEPHEVLGVAPDAQAPVVRAAFRALARKAHPDHGGSERELGRLLDAKEAMLS